MSQLAKLFIDRSENGLAIDQVPLRNFTPEQIRLAIQALMAEGRDALAYALGDAGIALYPHNEDMLAITGLLAVVREDWSVAIELITELIEMQGEKATSFSYLMLVRALICNLDLHQALDVVVLGLKNFPGNSDLELEYGSLLELLGLTVTQE